MNLPKRPKINPLDFPEVDLLVNKENLYQKIIFQLIL